MVTAAVALTAATLAWSPTSAFAAKDPRTLQYEVINEDSKVSAMMLGVINEDYVYILDKVENNRERVPGTNKPAWGSILNLNDNTVEVVDVNSNTFCASGGQLGNGTWVVAGGNQPIGPGGQNNTAGAAPYMDTDGRRALRLLEPVESGSGNASIAWIDNAGGLQMQSQRWYPGLEQLGDGSIVLIGGANNGGYINRNFPNDDPAYAAGGQGSLQNPSAGGANPTFEFYPDANNKGLQLSKFMVATSGLNMYPHMFLLPSGNIFMQANYSTTIWDYQNNNEYAMADMPGQIVRVYPASGAVAMLPLTPSNNYTPTILFCGGFYAPEDQWGDYGAPFFNPLTTPASDDCSSITPVNSDGTDNSKAQYVREEKLPEGRTMGQFIHLPTGQMLIVNGAEKGTAGYGNVTVGQKSMSGAATYMWTNVFQDANNNTVPTEGMTQNPTYTPVLYDPEKPMGSRLTQEGFGHSNIARLYHSSAVLLPDGSVLIGGSNPHMDVALTMPQSINGITAYNTTYELEKWYPDYYFEQRPNVTGLPAGLMYGGNTWSFTIDADYMGDSANYKANATKVMVIRPGFSTHAMNMGQRSIQLEHSYNVHDDGSVTYTVMPMPRNPNIFAPGPALLFITVDGIPSKGKYIQVGGMSFGGSVPNNFAASAGAAPTLPQSVNNSKYTAKPSSSGDDSFGTGKIVGVAVGAAVALLLILLGLLCWRRQAKRKAAKAGAAGAGAGAVYGQQSYRDTTGGGEYKRVNTPSSSVHAFAAPPGQRGSLATYDSFRMNDVSGPTTPYYDHPRVASAMSSRTPLGHAATPSGDYSSQGWGEHQAGDAGDYYRDNMNRGSGAAQYYNQYSGSHDQR